jgi:hypothetical protein
MAAPRRHSGAGAAAAGRPATKRSGRRNDVASRARPAQAIGGRTWCGVEYGHAPGYAHSFFEARPARGGADPFAFRS